ncbi:MAG: T9SS type A sorting domain-containing protein [Chitinophagales bacterium]|nr:T9SS type A sorting domain-containing protein [Chitinophagales bacterium]
MKNLKIYITLAAVFVFVSANAQRTSSSFLPFQNNISSPQLREVVDTIYLPSFIPVFEGGLGCFTGVYAAPDSGYVSGNNQYGDLAKAQFYSLSKLGLGDTGAVKNVLINVAYKTLSAFPGDVYAQVFNCDTDAFRPLDLLGTSNPVNLSAINSQGANTLFTFTTPVQVSDSFFVSIVLPNAKGDTIALLSTDDGCVTNSGWAFEMWNDSTWHQILNSWILDIDLAIFPVADLPITGIANTISDNDVSVFPNPVNDACNISFQNKSAQSFTLKVYNQTGSLVLEMKDFDLANRQSLAVDFSKFPNGIYNVLLQSTTQVIAKKAIVIH